MGNGKVWLGCEIRGDMERSGIKIGMISKTTKYYCVQVKYVFIVEINNIFLWLGTVAYPEMFKRGGHV